MPCHSINNSCQDSICLLYTSFEEALRVMHPFMPYITEALWKTMASLCKPASIDVPTLMLQPYPSPLSEKVNKEAETNMDWFKALVLAVRNIRGRCV